MDLLNMALVIVRDSDAVSLNFSEYLKYLYHSLLSTTLTSKRVSVHVTGKKGDWTPVN